MGLRALRFLLLLDRGESNRVGGSFSGQAKSYDKDVTLRSVYFGSFWKMSYRR